MNRRRGLEPVAAADGRDDQVKRRMFRVAAFIHEILRRVVRDPDLDQGLTILVMLAKMSAQSALSVVYLDHDRLQCR